MSCEDWIPFPLEAIDTIEYISRFTCDDHSHPIVRLTFVKPKATEAQALHAVAVQQAELRVNRFDFTKCANCLNDCSNNNAPGEPRRTCYNTCSSCGSGGYAQ
jgi:hypothetical protein